MAAFIAAEFAGIYGCFGAMAQEQPQSAFACSGEIITRGSASRIIDGRTFVLDDGREIRLAAIEVPALPLPQESAPAPGGAAAKDSRLYSRERCSRSDKRNRRRPIATAA